MEDKPNRMMITLEEISLAELTAVFNAAFANYYVPINTTEVGMRERIRRGRIDLSRSVGVTDGGSLVAFMLTGIEAGTAYNAGTGVLPAHRGRGLVRAMYDWAWPRWRRLGIERASLEVIVANERAIRAYEGVGFRRGRRLRSFKKDITVPAALGGVRPREVTNPDWEAYAALRPFPFSWDYRRSGIEALGEDYTYYEWGDPAEAPSAYAVVHRLGRIAQAGRRKDGPAWAELLSTLESGYTQLTWVNVGEEAAAIINTLKDLGWTHIIDQYEMTRSLEN